MSIRFERQALYEEVWSTPLTKLGAKYGLSDNGIRKVCKALAIPLPRGGHWAKVAAGHTVRRLPLPAHGGPVTFISRGPVPVSAASEYAEEDDAVWLKSRLNFEASDEAKFEVPDEVTRWHPAIAPFRAALAAAARKHADELKARDRQRDERAKLARPGPNFEVFRFQYLDRGILYIPHGEKVCFRVSILTYRRALAIANTLALAASRRKFTIEGSVEASRLLFRLEGATFSVSLRERQESTMERRAPPFDTLGMTRVYHPTNRLAIVVSRPCAGDFQLVDGSKPVETQLDAFFPKLYQSVVTMREVARSEKARAERQARYREEAAAVALKKAHEEALQKDAIEREAKLLEEARRWHQATQLRAYAAAVTTAALCTSAWRDWVLSVADRLDPVSSMERTTFQDHPDTKH